MRNKMKCKQCGKRIRIRESYNPTSYDEYEFCSQECSRKWLNKHTKSKKCIRCGRKFKATQPRNEWYCEHCRRVLDNNKIDNTTYRFLKD